ncbi:MAG: alanine--tRNA ligase [Candidatus Malihini olakiniferum]
MSKSTAEIRQAFLDFFQSKVHQIVSSSSLVPNNDPTLLFTNAGMNQFKYVFLGIDKRNYMRATTAQRCVRAGGKHNDLENVGYTARHHTFFEMLGNFSFGDYFKYDAIQYAWELLTSEKWFNLPKEKLWVTVYATDDEAYDVWANEVGVPVERIIRIGDNRGDQYESDNFWKMGDTGPCGPCSEIFYDHGEHIHGGLPGSPDEDGDRYVEIWNLVFMQFNRQANGTMVTLPKPSVDTGMGLERITAILQHVNSNYEIDVFTTLIKEAARIIGTDDLSNKSLRVIADHIRSCAFLISDGVIPSNENRGYVLRRIIRSAVRHGNLLGAKDLFFYKLVTPLIHVMRSAAEELKQQKIQVEQTLKNEEEQFARTLEHGLTLLDEEIKNLKGKVLEGEKAFRLYDTHGFPFDLAKDVCRQHNLTIDKQGFKRAMEEQRQRARKASGFSINHNNLIHIDVATLFTGYDKLQQQATVVALYQNEKMVDAIKAEKKGIVFLSETPFYGESCGQVGDTGALHNATVRFTVENTQKFGQAIGHIGILTHGMLCINDTVNAEVDSERRDRIRLNHSANHLLHAALRQVLGSHITQKGLLINDKFLRFDFSQPKAMTAEQILQVEDIVNTQIRRNHNVEINVVALSDAKAKGAVALFSEKYEDHVRMLTIGGFSVELCGGTHVNRTGDIGLFKIVSESGTSRGIRRIEAATGTVALTMLHSQSDILHDVTKLVKADSYNVVDKVQALLRSTRQLTKELQQLKEQQAAQESVSLSSRAKNINGVKLLVTQLENTEPNLLRTIVDDLKNQLGSAIIVLATVSKDKVNLISGVTKDLIDRIKAIDLISFIAQRIGGKGGGRPDMAQAGGNDPAKLPAALSSVELWVMNKLQTYR